MKNIIYLFITITLCLIMLLWRQHDHEVRLSRLEAGVVTIKKKQCSQDVVFTQKSLALISEIREIVTVPFTHVIPIDGGYLGIKEEE